MRIISLNINNFGGSKIKKSDYNYVHNKWEKVICKEKYKAIFEFVKDYDVIVFQEYDYNSVQGKMLLKALRERGYYSIWMEKYNIYNYPSITIIFAKEKNKAQDTIIHYKTEYHSKCSVFEISDMVVIGTHRPLKRLDEKLFWKELTEFFDKQLKGNKQVVLIGDMNLNIKKHESIDFYNRLLDKGAIDKGKKEDKATHYENGEPRRIDYAFVSENLNEKCVLHTTPCVINGKKMESIIKQDISDHEAIILEIF